MGRNAHMLVEVKMPGASTWRLLRTWPFTDRHNGFYDDLDAEDTYVMCGASIDSNTLLAMEIAPEQWTQGDYGVRMVSAEAFLRLLEKWENDPRGVGYALGHDPGRHVEYLHIGAQLQALTTPDDDAVVPTARVVYEYDGCPLTRTKSYVYTPPLQDEDGYDLPDGEAPGLLPHGSRMAKAPPRRPAHRSEGQGFQGHRGPVHHRRAAMSTPKTPWGYSDSADAEEWHHADSREEAIDAARSMYGAVDVWIVRGAWASIEQYIDADRIMENANECAGDDCGGDDPVFETRQGGDEALAELLAAWAKQYVIVRRWTAQGAAECVRWEAEVPHG